MLRWNEWQKVTVFAPNSCKICQKHFSCLLKSTNKKVYLWLYLLTRSQNQQETSFCLHDHYSGAFLPDLHALRRKAKANDSAALEPTLAKPSTPLLTGRELREKKKTEFAKYCQCRMIANYFIHVEWKKCVYGHFKWLLQNSQTNI